MPIYIAKHECGFEQEIFLQEDKETLVVPCYNCRRNIRIHQKRDRNLKVAEKDGVIGVLEQDARTS